ncbi:YciI family protein [Streptomyces sp. NBC_00237]|uniref:YciI family protein n=1 Tax=Streptomyces sp. NBC_00237 TaxID=2975687 RepID=UPI00225BD8EB|nr:YciI family protein [Streptomyces sp. NBC_00237]MCX5202913.1 YciI family protein [Streptomyces sp. NBC_00237]
MFVLELTYTAPVEQVDALMTDHVAWLDTQYEAGVFIASGRKQPRDGGIILAVAPSRDAIERIAAEDPFATGRVCEYRIVEFVATKTSEALSAYRQAPVA